MFSGYFNFVTIEMTLSPFMRLQLFFLLCFSDHKPTNFYRSMGGICHPATRASRPCCGRPSDGGDRCIWLVCWQLPQRCWRSWRWRRFRVPPSGMRSPARSTLALLGAGLHWLRWRRSLAEATPAQSRYSTFDRELTAVFSALRHFRFMLEGR
jgi:hypothetical protein